MGSDDGRRQAGGFANVVRLLVGFGFLAAAVGNSLFLLPDAEEQLESMLELTLFDWYRDAFDAVVMPAPSLWVGLLAVYELATGLLILARRRAVDVGLGMAVAFMLGIVPLIGWYSLTNLLTALVPAGLLFRRYERSLIDSLFRRPR